jgi:hypothetical protein
MVAGGLALTGNETGTDLIMAVNRYSGLDLDVYFRTKGLYACGIMMMAAGLMLLLRLPLLKLKELSRTILSTAILLAFFIHLLTETKGGIPVFDEYTAIYQFLCEYRQGESVAEKLSIITSPYFECRIIIPYSFILLVSSIMSEPVPLNLLVALNSFTLLIITIILFRTLHKGRNLLKWFPWLLFIIFNTGYMQSSFNALSGLCYNGALLFSISSIHFACRNTRNSFLLALFFSIAAILSFGNGMLTVPLIFLIITRLRNIKTAGAYLIPSVAMLALYFYEYQPQHNGEPQFDPAHFILYVPVFLGSSLQFFYSPYLPFITGLIILIYFIQLSIRRYDLKNPVLYFTLLFLILTACITASFRQTDTLDSALKLRYGIFSSFTLFCSLLIYIDRLQNQPEARFLRKIVFAALAFNFLSANFFYPESVLTIDHNREMLIRWKQGLPVEQRSAYYPPGLGPVLSCSYASGMLQIEEN